MITIFTPTYNRMSTLPRLYESICKQTDKNFEWLIIDDGSTDETKVLFDSWKKIKTDFPLRYYRVDNGGKARAINKALELAKGKYFFIVDSDDYITDDCIESLNKWFDEIKDHEKIIGVSGIRGTYTGKYINKKPDIDSLTGHIDASNIERDKLNLSDDMAEAFYTEKLRNYTFTVWETEKFLPEAVVWDRIALDGYKLRWYDKIIYHCEYMEGGLTRSSWKLLKENPMGYAQMFNMKLNYITGFKEQIQIIIQLISCVCLAGNLRYLLSSNKLPMTMLLFPVGYILSVKRRFQFYRILNLKNI